LEKQHSLCFLGRGKSPNETWVWIQDIRNFEGAKKTTKTKTLEHEEVPVIKSHHRHHEHHRRRRRRPPHHHHRHHVNTSSGHQVIMS